MTNKFANALKQEEPSAASLLATDGREGRKHIGGYFPRSVSDELRHLAIEENTTIRGPSCRGSRTRWILNEVLVQARPGCLGAVAG